MGSREWSERGGERSEGKVKRHGDEREKGGMSAMFEDEQCPLVTLASALLRLRCQIKRGWNRAMGGRNRSRGEGL